MKKISLLSFFLIITCNLVFSQNLHHHFYKYLKENKKDILNRKNKKRGDRKDANKIIVREAKGKSQEDIEKISYDKAVTAFKIKSSPIGQNTNFANTKPFLTAASSFNHTDATLAANFGWRNLSGGGSFQQKVSGEDSIAALASLNGITSGSIIEAHLQYTFFKTTSGVITPGFFINGKFTYNPVSNKYAIDTITLKQITANDVNMSGKIVIGYNFADGTQKKNNKEWYWAITAGYENGNSYTTNNSSAFNAPFGKSPNFYSVTEIFGVPTYKNINVLSGSISSVKVQLDPKEDTITGYAFAAELYMGYSFTLNKYSIQVPIYFIKGTEDKYSALNGGITFGYSWVPPSGYMPVTSGFSAQIFITTPFNFFTGFGEDGQPEEEGE